jgi:hypothetical protein
MVPARLSFRWPIRTPTPGLGTAPAKAAGSALRPPRSNRERGSPAARAWPPIELYAVLASCTTAAGARCAASYGYSSAAVTGSGAADPVLETINLSRSSLAARVLGPMRKYCASLIGVRRPGTSLAGRRSPRRTTGRWRWNLRGCVRRGRRAKSPIVRSRNSGGGVPAYRAGFAVAGRAATMVLGESPSGHAEYTAPLQSAPKGPCCQLPHRW